MHVEFQLTIFKKLCFLLIQARNNRGPPVMNDKKCKIFQNWKRI
jgi:hypothetical protein